MEWFHRTMGSITLVQVQTISYWWQQHPCKKLKYAISSSWYSRFALFGDFLISSLFVRNMLHAVNVHLKTQPRSTSSKQFCFDSTGTRYSIAHINQFRWFGQPVACAWVGWLGYKEILTNHYRYDRFVCIYTFYRVQFSITWAAPIPRTMSWRPASEVFPSPPLNSMNMPWFWEFHRPPHMDLPSKSIGKKWIPWPSTLTNTKNSDPHDVWRSSLSCQE